MHLGGALLIVVALVAAETASAAAPVDWVARVAVVLAGGIVVVFAAAAISGLMADEIRSNPDGVRRSLREYSRLRRVHTCIWMIVSLAAILLFQWPQWVGHELRHRVVLLDELCILLPLLLPMFFSHAAFFEVDLAAAAALRGKSPATALQNRWAYAWWYVRHEFGLIVVPLVALFLVRDLADPWLMPRDALADWLDPSLTPRASVLGWLVVGTSLIVVALAFPVLLRWVWPCEPLRDADLQDAVERECRAVGLATPRLFRWNTGGRVVNAVVAGMLPGSQRVLVSDALLAHFSAAEILAVLRHEIAHVRRHHILLRMAAMVGPLAACHSLGGAEASSEAYHALANLRPAAGDLAVLTAIVLGTGAYCLWVWGPFSRLLEIEADLVGCREPGHLESASAALYKLGCVYGLDRRSWLHPTIRTRLRVLRAAVRRESFAARLLRRVRVWKAAIAAVYVAAVAAVLWVGNW